MQEVFVVWWIRIIYPTEKGMVSVYEKRKYLVILSG